MPVSAKASTRSFISCQPRYTNDIQSRARGHMLLYTTVGNSCSMHDDDMHSYSMHLPCGLHNAGLGGLPWRTEALEEALLHLDSWSGWFHRSNGREVVRTLIAEASPTELNHMVSFELQAHCLPCLVCFPGIASVIRLLQSHPLSSITW